MGKRLEHQLVKVETGYQCAVCGWHWKTKPVTCCPGITRYDIGRAPENLKTRGQLIKKRLNPGTSPRGAIQSNRGIYNLYDESEATPFTAEQIKTQREEWRLAQYRICKKCKRKVLRKRWNPDWEVCDQCLNGVIEEQQIEEEIRLERIERKILRDKDRAIEWAREILGDSNVVILDTETTGLDWDDEIIQVGIVDLYGNKIYETLVKPTKCIPQEATIIHGITDQIVADAPTFDVIHESLRQFLDGRRVVVYNVEFDARMINQSMQKYGQPSALSMDRWECAMHPYAAYVGDLNEYYGTYRWQRLPGGDHSAVGDCLATLEVLKEMAGAQGSTETSDDGLA